MTRVPASTTSTSSPPNKVHSPPHESPAPRRAFVFFNPILKEPKPWLITSPTFPAPSTSCTADNAARAFELYNDTPADDDGFSLSDGFLLCPERRERIAALDLRRRRRRPRAGDRRSSCGARSNSTSRDFGGSSTPTPARGRASTPSAAAPASSISPPANRSAAISTNEWLTRVLADPHTAGEA